MLRKLFAFWLLALSATPALANHIDSAVVHPGCSSYTIELTASALSPGTTYTFSWTFTGYPTTTTATFTFTAPSTGTFDTGPITEPVGPFTTGTFTFKGTASLSKGGVVQNTIPITFSPSTLTCKPPPNECPLTQGFWKNHPSAWPVTSLTLGKVTYTEAQLLAILKTPAGGDASLILAHQLIAADLNIANGSNPVPVSAIITNANSLLSGFSGTLPYHVSPSSTTGAKMVNDATTLDNYNSGALTPNCTQ